MDLADRSCVAAGGTPALLVVSRVGGDLLTIT